jgi:hypothetical protein
MGVTIKVPEKLAAEARARGMSVEVYVQKILARQTIETTGEGSLQSVRAAIDRILQLRKGNKLAGLQTKDLIHRATRTDGHFRCGRLGSFGLVLRGRGEPLDR